jgi:hypothetical protein
MTSYLLLRDNKESGPYSMEELLRFGLKPYDLVWIKGKSAAWRYPSEVDELKPYAPVVEEQPFDRFYKKEGRQDQKEASPAITHQPAAPIVKQEQPLTNDDYSRYIPAEKKEETPFVAKRSVFVTLPDQKQEVKQAIQPVQNIQPLPLPFSPISVTENPEAAEIKYSQPLDDIKEMYVKALLQRKDKKVKHVHFINMLKKVAVFGGLIILGVLAGFAIRSNTGKNNEVIQQMLQASSPLINNNQDTQQNKQATGSSQSEEQPGNASVAGLRNEETPSPKKINESPEQTEQPATVRIRKETMLLVPKPKENFPPRQQLTQPAQTDPVTGERSRTVRSLAGDGKLEEKTEIRSNKNGLYKLVSVASNDYQRVAFGGIRNLYLTVTNDSKYELDNVIVELQYLKPSEETLKTENIQFVSIAPNASSTIKVPDTNRGIKVSYKIINIDSKQNSEAVAGK